MSSNNDGFNELSWLKSSGKAVESKDKAELLRESRPSSQENKEDGPSWLYDDAIPKPKEPLNSKVSKSKAAPLQSAQQVNSKAVVADVDDDDEAESCCGCCPSDPILFSFQCFHFSSGSIALAAFAANIYTLSRPNIFVKDAIVRCYALVFCLLIVIVEFDWRYIVNKVRFVDYWILRGFFYTFVGFLTCK
jgi:hypothetical protein